VRQPTLKRAGNWLSWSRAGSGRTRRRRDRRRLTGSNAGVRHDEPQPMPRSGRPGGGADHAAGDSRQHHQTRPWILLRRCRQLDRPALGRNGGGTRSNAPPPAWRSSANNQHGVACAARTRRGAQRSRGHGRQITPLSTIGNRATRWRREFSTGRREFNGRTSSASFLGRFSQKRRTRRTVADLSRRINQEPRLIRARA